MENRNLPSRLNKNSSPLWVDIKKFSGSKYYLAAVFILIGLMGLLIPVIPGLLFFLFALALFKPGLMTKIRSKIKSFIKNKAD